MKSKIRRNQNLQGAGITRSDSCDSGDTKCTSKSTIILINTQTEVQLIIFLFELLITRK